MSSSSNKPTNNQCANSHIDSQKSNKAEQTSTKSSGKAYATVWRWHFYTGLFIAPFLIALAITGLGMLLFANIDGRHGELTTISVPTEQQPHSLTTQVQAVQNHLPEASVVQYIAPKTADTVAVFKTQQDNGDGKVTTMVAVNPYSAEVVSSYPKGEGLYDLMDDIHGDLLIGKQGDYLLETAASLTILMILSGWYLWWSRQKSVRKSLLPSLRQSTQKAPQSLSAKKRTSTQWWRNTHGATGAWVSVFLFLFLVSGLAWAGIWGGKMVQAWSQFPAEKWGKPESTLMLATDTKTSVSEGTHGEVLNPTGAKEVPWILEQTPMPTSTVEVENVSQEAVATKIVDTKTADNKSAVALVQGKITLENLDAFAKNNTIAGRYQLNFPKDEKGVWTVSQDSMSYDSNSPTADRTIHIDQYSGEVLADVRYAEYNLMGKFMAVGIALHMGTLGWWSILANALICFAIIFMCLGSLVMWWKRRPQGSVGIVAPKKPSNKQDSKTSHVGVGFLLLLLVTAACFPLALVAIIAIFLIDFVLISRVPRLSHWFH